MDYPPPGEALTCGRAERKSLVEESMRNEARANGHGPGAREPRAVAVSPEIPGPIHLPEGPGAPMRRLPRRRLGAAQVGRPAAPGIVLDDEEIIPTWRGMDRRGGSLWPTVSVVIPAKNEERNISHVLRALPSGVDEVVLVDGASHDRTVDVAREMRPNILVVPQAGRGKGDALACGFAACSGEVIVTLDADGSTDPSEIPIYVGALLAGADFVKGSRHAVGGGSADFTHLRRLGNRWLSIVVNLLYRTHHTDVTYGYNAFWRDCLPKLAVDCSGFEVETLMTIRANKSGLRVSEVPSYEQRRLHGQSNLNAIRDGWRILRMLLRERRATLATRLPIVEPPDDAAPGFVPDE